MNRNGQRRLFARLGRTGYLFSVAVVVTLLAACSGNRGQDPDKMEHLVGRQVYVLAGYLNGGQFTQVAKMLHPDAPVEWRNDIAQMPLVKEMLSGKVINVRGGKIQPDIFHQDQRAPILIFGGSVIGESATDKGHLSAQQLGTVVTIWRPLGGTWLLVGVEPAR